MSIQIAVTSAGILQKRSVKETKIRKDRCHTGYTVSLALYVDVTFTSSGVFHIYMNETSVKKRDQWNQFREGATDVDSLVYSVVSLIYRIQTKVRILDFQQRI